MTVDTRSAPEQPARVTPPAAHRLHRPALLVILIGGLAVRLVGIGNGMPFAFNEDEALHFVPEAAAAADGHLDPGYYQNPSALTYLLAAVLRLCFLGQSVTERLIQDPASVFLIARVVVALCGTLLIFLVYRIGARFFEPTVGLLAGGLVAFAFLPVFYSHQALNDVPTLLPVAIGLGASVAVRDRGDWRSYLVAGAVVGAATGTKYLAAPLCVVVALAALMRVLDHRADVRSTLVRLAGSGAACVAALVALNPFLVINFPTARAQFLAQSAVAAEGKIGQHGTGWSYYPGTLLWGLGVVPVVLVTVGLALALRADARKALLLITFPVVLYLYMAGQGRFFGRWLLPAYPALATLAAYGALRVATWCRGRSWLPPRSARFVLPGVAALLLAQPVVDSARNDVVLLHTDTRLLAHDWIAENVPEGARVVIEPSVPSRWVRPDLIRFPVEHPYADYEKRLDPGLVDTYRDTGYCWVVVVGHQHDRGISAGLTGARDYYAALDRQSTLEQAFTPYRAGAEPPAFSFDFSFDWYPLAYERPGPTIEIRRLRGC